MPADTLSDQAWAEICEAAGRTPDAEARAALSTLLFKEYPRFAYKREPLEDTLHRAERMLKHLKAFAADYRAQFTVATERVTTDLWHIEQLQLLPLDTWRAARVKRRANRGQKSQQREWLYQGLCSIWLDYFHGDLTVTVTWGGPPGGRLIKFMQAAMRQIMPRKLPSAEALRRAITRERKDYNSFAQYKLDLRQQLDLQQTDLIDRIVRP